MNTPAQAWPPPRFYDDTQWWNITPGADAALYNDGEFAAPASADKHFDRVKRITVKADYRNCGIVDLLEQPWYTRSMLRAYVRGRLTLGLRARVYTDQAQAAEAVAALKDDGTGDLLADQGVSFWVATLDGVQRTPAELAASLAARWHAPEITAGRIWANQWLEGVDGAPDESALFQAW